MAEDDRGTPSPKNEPTQAEASEDAETRAARRELKQSSISDPNSQTATNANDDSTASRPETPSAGEAKEHVMSPKKKRAHDQLEGAKDEEEDDSKSVGSTDSAKDRATRTEPEKKRARDEEQAENKPNIQPSEDQTKNEDATGASDSTASKKNTLPPSSSAFAASSFGKLTGASSPFASLGGAGSGASKGSVFGGSSNTASSFGSAANSSAPSSSTTTTTSAAGGPKLTFGGGGSSMSPFAGLSTGSNGFGSSSAFGSASAFSSGKPLQSFAAPGGKPIKNDKPAKPFGAPDSDVESDGDDNASDDTPAEEAERSASPEKESEDRKKTKLQKVEVNDGEAGEATVVSVRAKMFYHDKEAGWKERGAGMLKINVPESCVDFDDAGVPIPGTFDASGLELDEEEAGAAGNKVCRLVMRQDQTHRVILNTALVAAMKFEEKASLKSVGILFTAFEGADAKPVSITMRMSAANAKAFMNEIDTVQRELRS